MLRSEFDNYPLWNTIERIESAAQQIKEEGHAPDVPPLETVLFYVRHVRSFRELATTSSALFSAAMLEPVARVMTSVENSLNFRMTNGTQYVSQLTDAAVTAETSLMHMGPWPRPYARGGQVTQISTLFEDLLELQRSSVAALEQSHINLQAEIVEWETAGAATVAKTSDSLEAFRAAGEAIAADITSEQVRIDNVVTEGLNRVSSIETENTDRYKAWIANREAEFLKEFLPLKEQIVEDLVTSRETLDRLKETNTQFQNLYLPYWGSRSARLSSFRTRSRHGYRASMGVDRSEASYRCLGWISGSCGHQTWCETDY
jgi:hypothetical protein